jgi:hypothetical protein
MPVPKESDLFEKDVGEWIVDIVAHMPQGEHRTTGTASSRRIGGGRWLVMDFRTDPGDFEGHGIYGYDPDQGYVGTWVDTMRPFLAVMKGTWNEAAGEMTYRGEAKMGDRTVRWREVTSMPDADTRLFRNFTEGPDGTEHETMTATYRRRR